MRFSFDELLQISLFGCWERKQFYPNLWLYIYELLIYLPMSNDKNIQWRTDSNNETDLWFAYGICTRNRVGFFLGAEDKICVCLEKELCKVIWYVVKFFLWWYMDWIFLSTESQYYTRWWTCNLTDFITLDIQISIIDTEVSAD